MATMTKESGMMSTMMPNMMSGLNMQMPVPGMMPGMGMMSPGMMIPRCTMKMEKISGGMKMTCTSDDTMAVSMMQNLCAMMPGAMCTCCCLMNGMPCCTCAMMMATCTCENMANGVTITCTSGDAKAEKMIQCCCDCCNGIMDAGCMCCVMMGNLPVCCATR